jgi:hypothetical protein
MNSGTKSQPRKPRGALAREKAQLDRTMYFVEGYESAARKAGHAGEEIRRLVREQAEESPPVRVRLVSDLLDVSDHTIADWCKRGILEERSSNPRRVSLLSLLRTMEALKEVRAAGRGRDLTSAVLNKLELEELSEDARFRRSLAQAKRGERGEWPEGF